MLEDYYDTQDEEIIQDFKLILWSSKYTFKKFKRYYTYEVNEDKLNFDSDLVDLFKKYEVIEVTYCKSFHNTELDSIDYIRIHINNMFGFLVDEHVYYPSEYYSLILTPRKEYYKAIKDIESGKEVNVEEIKQRISDANYEAERIKQETLSKKIQLDFSEYRELINTYIDRIFSNYLPPFEYEQEHGWELRVSVDGWNDDNYVVKYFCRSLTGYMRNYIRDIKPKEIKVKKCIICGVDFEYKSSKRLYCDKCKRNKQLEWQRNSMKYTRLKVK